MSAGGELPTARRRLGRSGLEIAPVVFGAWAIGGWSWGGSDDDEAVRAIRASVDAGCDAIDTAPVYGFGRSERVVGRAIAGLRGRVVLATKVGLRWDDERGPLAFEARDDSGRTLRVRRNARPDSVRAEVEASLARLATDVIDLVQVHWPDPETPIAETIGALVELRREGKLREIGVSNYSVAELEEARRALGPVPLASDQPRYSLVARGIERDVLPWAREHGVGILAYSPLEQGLLTGAVGASRSFSGDDGRARRATFRAENRARVNALLDAVVRPIAARHGATPAQVVLAWTIAQPGITAAIAGARTAAQARENAGALRVALERDELAVIRAAFEALVLVPPPAAGLRARIARLVRALAGRR